MLRCMEIYTLSLYEGQMPTKKYSFYESDPILQDLYDELVRNRDLTPTIHRLAINGLGKDITNTRQKLKKRMASMRKIDGLYKTLQDKGQEKIEALYEQYKLYRENLIDGESQYTSSIGLDWIEKYAKGLKTKKKVIVADFEQRYKQEK